MSFLQRQLSLWPRRRMVLEAALWLAVARLCLAVIPFTRIAPRLGVLHRGMDANGARGGDPAEARQVARAVERAARLLPFSLVCLPRALAAWKMLEQRNLNGRIHFGAVRSSAGDALRTHAWVDACGVEVTGYPEAYHCAEIGFYARRHLEN